MKTKTKFAIACASLIPILLALIVNLVITITIESGKLDENTFNAEFCLWITGIAGLGFCFMLTSLIDFSRHSNKLDCLDEAIDHYVEAKKSMIRARDQYTDLIEKEKINK